MTPASIRARIAASDGSDQGEILQHAYFLLIATIDVPWEERTKRNGQWLKLRRAQAYTDAALLIADAVLMGWEIASSPTYAEVRENPPPAAYDEQPYELTGLTSGAGPTRALAIIDAVCAAVERKDETNG